MLNSFLYKKFATTEFLKSAYILHCELLKIWTILSRLLQGCPLSPTSHDLHHVIIIIGAIFQVSSLWHWLDCCNFSSQKATEIGATTEVNHSPIIISTSNPINSKYSSYTQINIACNYCKSWKISLMKFLNLSCSKTMRSVWW